MFDVDIYKYTQGWRKLVGIGVEITSKTKHNLFTLTLQPRIHSLKKKGLFICIFAAGRFLATGPTGKFHIHSFLIYSTNMSAFGILVTVLSKSQRYLQRWNKTPAPLMKVILSQDHRLMSNYWYNTAWQVCEYCRWWGNRREFSTQPQEEAWVGFRAEEWITIHQAKRWESIF